MRRIQAQILDDFAQCGVVGEATNGREAVEMAGASKPDVVLMDLVMPDMDGVAATRAIKENWPEIQVIALTSFQEGEMHLSIEDRGSDLVR